MSQPASPIPSHRRFSVKRLIVGSLVVVVVAAAIFGYFAYVQLDEIVRDSYAQWWVADMLIDYMERNHGAWPQNWDDLREPYEILAGRSGPTWSFDELQKRVGIQFDASPSELVKANNAGDQPPFRVVYLNNGKQHWWAGHEPNAVILKYLLERAARPATYNYPKRPAPDEQHNRAKLSELGGAVGVGWRGAHYHREDGFATRQLALLRLGNRIAEGSQRAARTGLGLLAHHGCRIGCDCGFNGASEHLSLRHKGNRRWIKAPASPRQAGNTGIGLRELLRCWIGTPCRTAFAEATEPQRHKGNRCWTTPPLWSKEPYRSHAVQYEGY